jgi:hypothetical protein
MTRSLRLPFLVACVLPLVGAQASPGFPTTLKRELGMRGNPPCSVCHQDGITGLGSPGTPFRDALTERGLVPANDASLALALTRMREDGVDTNGDGKLDVENLADFEDPNGQGPLAESAFDPRYGCGASATGGGSAAWALFLFGGWMARRRTRP